MVEYPMEMQFPVILDGATGTELQKRGFTGDMSAEQWVLEHPESILEIQRKYVASGSNVLYAPTFGGNRQKLDQVAAFLLEHESMTGEQFRAVMEAVQAETEE